jgi:outer membrane protein assembly factor BamB
MVRRRRVAAQAALLLLTCFAGRGVAQPMPDTWSLPAGNAQNTGQATTRAGPAPCGSRRFTVPLGRPATDPPVFNGKGLLFYVAGIGLEAVNATSGELLWEVAPPGVSMLVHGPSLARDGTVYVAGFTPSDTVSAVSAVSPSGTVAWTALLPGGGAAAPLIGPDGTLYVCSYVPGLTATALWPNGTVRWSVDLGPAEAFSGPTLSNNGRVVYVPYNTSVVALDAATGRQRWAAAMPGSPLQPVTVGPRGTLYAAVYYSTQSVSGLVAVSQHGVVLWSSPLPGIVGGLANGGLALSPDGSVLYRPESVAMQSVRFAARSTANGSVLWTYPLTNTSASFSTRVAVGVDGTAYAVASMLQPSAAILNAFAPNGTVLWTYALRGNQAYAASLGPDGAVYVGSLDGSANMGYLDAVDCGSGA